MKSLPDCIVPAAGLSSRMGKWKIGMTWGKSTVIETVADTALAAGCRTIIAGGFRFTDLCRIFEKRKDVILAEIPDWELGMGSTIRGALKLVESDSVFILPGDMPLVRSSDFLRLSEQENGIFTRPVYQGILGHPVLLGPQGVASVLKSTKGQPLRDSLRELPGKLIAWDYSGVIKDVDTDKDYENAKMNQHMQQK